MGIRHHFDYLIHGKNTANGLGVGEEGGGNVWVGRVGRKQGLASGREASDR